MCGRYVQSSSLDFLGYLYDAKVESEPIAPRFNASPRSWLPVLRARPSGERVIHLLRWGLIPQWHKDDSYSNRLINARAESLSSRASFKEPFARRRCIVPADGFYEWRAEDGGKQPYYIYPSDDDVLSIAGIWDRWIRPGTNEVIDSFAIVTTDSNPLVGTIHPRMPAILTTTQACETWLDRKSTPSQLGKVLVPAPVEYLAVRSVRADVNSTRNEGPALIGNSRR